MAKKRGRQPGFQMSDEHRVKIQNSNILNALIEHATGARDMSATQVSAGLGLLRKVLPDLTAVEHSGEVAKTYVIRTPAPVGSMAEWQQQYAQPAAPTIQ